VSYFCGPCPPAFRAVVKFDNALYKWVPPMDLQLRFPYYLTGYDDENRSIWVVEFGKWNLRKV
ncbi:unnamed protein product, partial [Allacma fusca]